MVARCSPCPAAAARKNGYGKKAVIGNSTLLLLATSSNTFPFARTGKVLTSKPHLPQTRVHQPLSNSDSSFLLTTMSTRRFFSSNIHVAEVSAISGSGISNVSVRGLVRY
jgi:hypothetical protein